MPWYVVHGLPVHLNMGGRKAPPPCRARVERKGKPCACAGISVALCDWELEEGRGTCSMPICQEHRTELGKDRDLCPVHASRVPGLFDEV